MQIVKISNKKKEFSAGIGENLRPNLKAESGELKKLEYRIQESEVKRKGGNIPALCF
jgi:membrane glycosyltransferase